MSQESDGIDESFEGQLRMLITSASQLAERLQRAREANLRQQERDDRGAAYDLQRRLDAERAAARAHYAPVFNEEWWTNSRPEHVAATYATAKSWSNEDPAAQRAATYMEEELKRRYGIDTRLGDSAAVLARLEEELARLHGDAAAGERHRAAEERAEAERLINLAESEDARAAQDRAAAEHQPDESHGDAAASSSRAADAREDAAQRYDSAERRDTWAADMRARGVDANTASERVRADAGQAKPATAAVSEGQGGRPPSLASGRNRSRTKQRSERER